MEIIVGDSAKLRCNLERISYLHWPVTRRTNYLEVEPGLEALKNSAKGTIRTRISANLILLLVES